MSTLHSDESLITLTRIVHLPEGTLGRFSLPSGFICYSIERPWRNNMPFSSCIPDGEYALSWYQSGKFGKSYPIGPKLENVPKRTSILIHPANLPSQVQGCIAIGLHYTFLNNIPKVLFSVDAFTILMNWLGVPRSGELICKRILIESASAKNID